MGRGIRDWQQLTDSIKRSVNRQGVEMLTEKTVHCPPVPKRRSPLFQDFNYFSSQTKGANFGNFYFNCFTF